MDVRQQTHENAVANSRRDKRNIAVVESVVTPSVPLRIHYAILPLRGLLWEAKAAVVATDAHFASALRCAIIKLRFKMVCSLGRVQIYLTLLSLRCAL